MGFQDYYDKAGKPIEMMQWATLLQDRSYSDIAKSVNRGYLISTVWLGLNHDYARFMPGRENAPPVIFETMIFDPEGGVLDYQERYCTEEAARVGHERAKAWLREKFEFEEIIGEGPTRPESEFAHGTERLDVNDGPDSA